MGEEGVGEFTIPWSKFNTECWTSGNGTAYDGTTPLAAVLVYVPGAATEPTPFDFCLTAVSQAP